MAADKDFAVQDALWVYSNTSISAADMSIEST